MPDFTLYIQYITKDYCIAHGTMLNLIITYRGKESTIYMA